MWAKRKEPNAYIHPLLKLLMAEADERRWLDKEIAYRSGLAANTFRKWRYGTSQPTLETFSVFAETFGYELTLVKKEVKK